MSIFSENFKYLRKERGFTQDSLALEMGMTRASICAYEDGRAMPPYPKLKSLSVVLGCSVEQLTEMNLKELISVQAKTPLENAIEKNDPFYEDLFLEERGSTFVPNFEETEALTTRATKPKENEKLETFETIKVIPVVGLSDFDAYASNGFSAIKEGLTSVQMPMAALGTYRAFSSADDFPVKNSILVGLLVKSASAIKDGVCHIIISKKYGVLYRKVYNQFKTKGLLVLSAEVKGIATIDLPVSEISEVWEIKAYMSYSLPEPKVDLGRAANLVKKLKTELSRFE